MTTFDDGGDDDFTHTVNMAFGEKIAIRGATARYNRDTTINRNKEKETKAHAETQTSTSKI